MGARDLEHDGARVLKLPAPGPSDVPSRSRRSSSAFKMECCPPSPWNAVHHQRGTVSAFARNTQYAISALSYSDQGTIVPGHVKGCTDLRK